MPFTALSINTTSHTLHYWVHWRQLSMSLVSICLVNCFNFWPESSWTQTKLLTLWSGFTPPKKRRQKRRGKATWQEHACWVGELSNLTKTGVKWRCLYCRSLMSWWVAGVQVNWQQVWRCVPRKVRPQISDLNGAPLKSSSPGLWTWGKSRYPDFMKKHNNGSMWQFAFLEDDSSVLLFLASNLNMSTNSG